MIIIINCFQAYKSRVDPLFLRLYITSIHDLEVVFWFVFVFDMENGYVYLFRNNEMINEYLYMKVQYNLILVYNFKLLLFINFQTY